MHEQDAEQPVQPEPAEPAEPAESETPAPDTSPPEESDQDGEE
jgi:hypothetical protein